MTTHDTSRARQGRVSRAPIHISYFTFLAAFLLAGQPARGFVYETEQQFLTTGDFDGDGKPDLAIVDLASGRVRLGYQQSPGVFNWVDWRASDVKGVTGVSVGKLFETKRDARWRLRPRTRTITRAGGRQSGSATPPQLVKTATLGLSALAIDVGGAGNTPAARSRRGQHLQQRSDEPRDVVPQRRQSVHADIRNARDGRARTQTEYRSSVAGRNSPRRW
jgi:hypothetical protein